MNTVLFLNHRQRQCGVYQYGFRSASILQKSKKYNFLYCEIESESAFMELIRIHNPSAIIYNYHPLTMSWVNGRLIKRHPNTIHLGIHHEGQWTEKVGFDHYIMTDCTFVDSSNRHSVPRPLFENKNIVYAVYPIPTIGSFGFGFYNKGFERIVRMVNDQFDTALIRLHIPFAHYGDADGYQAKSIAKICRSQISNPNIRLEITHDFFTDEQLLHFLAGNWVNAFLYDEMPGRGLSSVIDYALSVGKRIAITNTNMFRHISKTIPSICVENTSLKDIIGRDGSELDQYGNIWSNENFISKYESIMDKAIK